MTRSLSVLLSLSYPVSSLVEAQLSEAFNVSMLPPTHFSNSGFGFVSSASDSELESESELLLLSEEDDEDDEEED